MTAPHLPMDEFRTDAFPGIGESKRKIAGREARKAGKPKSDNPYKSEGSKSNMYEDWNKGWEAESRSDANIRMLEHDISCLEAAKLRTPTRRAALDSEISAKRFEIGQYRSRMDSNFKVIIRASNSSERKNLEFNVSASSSEEAKRKALSEFKENKENKKYEYFEVSDVRSDMTERDWQGIEEFIKEEKAEGEHRGDASSNPGKEATLRSSLKELYRCKNRNEVCSSLGRVPTGRDVAQIEDQISTLKRNSDPMRKDADWSVKPKEIGSSTFVVTAPNGHAYTIVNGGSPEESIRKAKKAHGGGDPNRQDVDEAAAAWGAAKKFFEDGMSWSAIEAKLTARWGAEMAKEAVRKAKESKQRRGDAKEYFIVKKNSDGQYYFEAPDGKSPYYPSEKTAQEKMALSKERHRRERSDTGEGQKNFIAKREERIKNWKEELPNANPKDKEILKKYIKEAEDEISASKAGILRRTDAAGRYDSVQAALDAVAESIHLLGKNVAKFDDDRQDAGMSGWVEVRREQWDTMEVGKSYGFDGRVGTVLEKADNPGYKYSTGRAAAGNPMVRVKWK